MIRAIIYIAIFSKTNYVFFSGGFIVIDQKVFVNRHGIIFFKEPYNIIKIIFLLVIVVGVMGLSISDILLNK